MISIRRLRPRSWRTPLPTTGAALVLAFFLAFAVACGSSGTAAPDAIATNPTPAAAEGSPSVETAAEMSPTPAGATPPSVDSPDETSARRPSLTLAPLPVLEEDLKTALSLSRAAVVAYRQGHFEAAAEALESADEVLREAALPEPFARAGLDLLNSTLRAEVSQEAEDREPPPPGLESLRRRLAAAAADREARRHLDMTRRLEPIFFAFGASPPEDPVLLDAVAGRLGEIARSPSSLRSALARRARYGTDVLAVLEGAGVPATFEAVALVESDYNPRARSPAGARGLWQLVPRTGRGHGASSADLNDPVGSTRAAASYWRELESLFGPDRLLLSLAAYNAGENRVLRCLRRIDDPHQRAYAKVAPCLPPETRRHVPKVLAAFLILDDPTTFGVQPPPPAAAAEASQALSTAASSSDEARSRVHVVEAGDTLYRIARLHGLSITNLARWNGIGDPRSLRPGQRLRLTAP